MQHLLGVLSSADTYCLRNDNGQDLKRRKLIYSDSSIIDLVDIYDKTLFKTSLCLNRGLNYLFFDIRHHSHRTSPAPIPTLSPCPYLIPSTTPPLRSPRRTRRRGRCREEYRGPARGSSPRPRRRLRRYRPARPGPTGRT